MRPRYCTSFHDWVPSVVDDPAPEHPVSNLGPALKAKWKRTWRGQDDAAAPRLVFEITTISPVSVPAIFLNNATFDSVLLETSADGVSWTTVDTYALARDAELGRRKLLIDDALTTRWVGLTPADLDPNYAYYELGAVALCAELVTMGQGPERPDGAVIEPATRADYLSGGAELNIEGEPLRIITFSGRWILDRVGADLNAIIGARKATPFLLDEQDGDASHVSIVQRTQDVSRARAFKYDEIGFVFEECA